MNNCDSSATYKLQMEIKDLPSAVFSLDVNPNPDINQFVFGCSNGNIWSVTYDVENNNVENEPCQFNFSKFAYDHIAAEEFARKQKKHNSPMNA